MTVLLIDTPLPGVRRLTLNRPEKRRLTPDQLGAWGKVSWSASLNWLVL